MVRTLNPETIISGAMDVVIQKDESHRELIWDWNLTASAVKRLQSMNYQIRDSISYQERLTAIQELNAEIEKAILDEQDAQRMYEKMTALARKAGLDEKAIEIDLIRGQRE